MVTFLWDPPNENINNERAPEYHFRCVGAYSRKLYIPKTILYNSIHFSSASCHEICYGQNLYQLWFNSIDSWFPYLLSGSSRSKWLSSDPENKVVSQQRLRWWIQDSQTSISLKRRVCRLWDLIIRRGNLTPKQWGIWKIHGFISKLKCEKIKAVMEREGKRRGSWALGCTLDMGTDCFCFANLTKGVVARLTAFCH